MDNYDKLINKEIIIIPYLEFQPYPSEGFLIHLTVYIVYHIISIVERASGSPIFLKDSTKVVGIHMGYIET